MDEYSLIWNKLLWKYISENKMFILFYTLVTTLTWPLEAISLSKLYSNLVTSIKKKVDFKKIFNVRENVSEGNVFGTIFLIFIIWILLLGFYTLKHKLEEKLIPDYITFVRLQLVNGAINSRKENFTEIKVGEYVSIISDLTFIFEDLIYQITNRLLPTFLGIVLVNIYYYFNSINLGLLSTFFVFLRLGTIYNYGTDYSVLVSERDKVYHKMNEKFSDLFSNSMNVHLNNTVELEKEKQKDINEKHNKYVQMELEMSKNITVLTNFITIVIFISTILFSIYLYSNKQISLNFLLTIAFIEIKLVGTWMELDHTIIKFFKRLGAVYAAKNVLNTLLKDTDSVKNTCNIKNGSIKIKDLSFGYNNKDLILKDLNLNINSGERVGILGRSGSGKSTLMKILVGLQKQSNGEIKIGNCNIKNIKTENLRKDVTYINQKTSLFDGTVFDNILYGNNISKEDVMKFLTKYDLNILYSGLKNGINTHVGVGGSNLSLGMQKVTIILRGIFKESKIYIFDEPLAGLDKKSREKIMKIINDIQKDKTIIIVTHDPEILVNLNTVYDMNQINKK